MFKNPFKKLFSKSKSSPTAFLTTTPQVPPINKKNDEGEILHVSNEYTTKPQLSPSTNQSQVQIKEKSKNPPSPVVHKKEVRANGPEMDDRSNQKSGSPKENKNQTPLIKKKVVHEIYPELVQLGPNQMSDSREKNKIPRSNVSPVELNKPEDKSHENNKANASTQSSFLKVKRLKEIAQGNKDAIKKLKENTPFEDSHFKYFNQDNKNNKTDIVWLRPKELVPNPTIGMKNIKPDEVIQGNLGDCWFIAALGAVANYPVLYNKVFTEELPLYGDNHKGYVKVRFWQYGEWVDIYIDDKLPTRNGNLIYGRCKTTSNFWVPLLEKAYAKLMGSYENMNGGLNERALIDLTGGIYLSFEAGEFDSLADRYRFENELSNSSFIGCVSRRSDKDEGYDGHAYSLLRINDFNVDETLQRIYTLQNPHGRANELSRLESRDPIWSKLDADAKTKVLYDDKDILTWVNAESIKKFFNAVELIYYIPGFNKKEVLKQKYLFEFTEKWKIEDQNMLLKDVLPNSPHYLLHVISADGANVIANLLQDETVVKTFCSMTVFIFKVKNSNNNANKKLIGVLDYDKVPDEMKYFVSRQHKFERKLTSGYYVMVPKVKLINLEELAYLFRVYSKEQINVEKLTCDYSHLKFETSDKQIVNVLILRCGVCQQQIKTDAKNDEKNKVPYHEDCRISINSCDTCNQESNCRTYVMEHGMTKCTDCILSGVQKNYEASKKYPKK